MFRTRKEKLLEKALRQFVGDHVADRVLRLGEEGLGPHWEKRELSLAFFDVASFSCLAGSTPEDSALLIYEYMSLVTQGIVETGGVVDGFYGDSIFGYWGASGAVNHAGQSVQCAIETTRRLEQWASRRAASGAPALKAKIGVHSGPVGLGIYGTNERLKFTAMGDAVNLACGLCNLCPTHSASCLVSQTTLQKTHFQESFRSIGELSLKGQEQALEVFALLG